MGHPLQEKESLVRNDLKLLDEGRKVHNLNGVIIVFDVQANWCVHQVRRSDDNKKQVKRGEIQMLEGPHDFTSL